MSDDIVIHHITNGATVTKLAHAPHGTTAYVFGEEEGVAGLVDLLQMVMEELHLGSRYAAERIQIKIVHGDKYECQGCGICRPEDL